MGGFAPLESTFCKFLLSYFNIANVYFSSPPPKLLQESASGLLYLHSVGIIHRDIKPANILVGAKGSVAKIADLGISRIADTSVTMTEKGTLLYQAPELSRGERYDFSADVYSFALTMYELCDRVSGPVEKMYRWRRQWKEEKCDLSNNRLSLSLSLLHIMHSGSPLHEIREGQGNQACDGYCRGGAPPADPQHVESGDFIPHHVFLVKRGFASSLVRSNNFVSVDDHGGICWTDYVRSWNQHPSKKGISI